MIRPPGRAGVAFTDAGDGDARSDPGVRSEVSLSAGAPTAWATAVQVHGSDVVRVESPGSVGDADALWTTDGGLVVAVFTADCLGVVIHADGAVGVAHAGWRGARDSVVARLCSEMDAAGHRPERAEVGPGIGTCCFEVGAEVTAEFPGHESLTTWDTDSVDLVAVVQEQLEGLDVWVSGACTMHEPGWFSHRENRTPQRMAAMGWLE